MAGPFSTINGAQIVSGTLLVPSAGLWTADVQLAGSTALSGVKGFSIPGMSGSADGSPFGSLAGLNGFGASAMNPGALAKIGQNFGASGGQSGGILSSIMSNITDEPVIRRP